MDGQLPPRTRSGLVVVEATPPGPGQTLPLPTALITTGLVSATVVLGRAAVRYPAVEAAGDGRPISDRIHSVPGSREDLPFHLVAQKRGDGRRCRHPTGEDETLGDGDWAGGRAGAGERVAGKGRRHPQQSPPTLIENLGGQGTHTGISPFNRLELPNVESGDPLCPAEERHQFSCPSECATVELAHQAIPIHV